MDEDALTTLKILSLGNRGVASPQEVALQASQGTGPQGTFRCRVAVDSYGL